ncbi:hypothetical protein PHJA_002818200 [Phtheirospermum japonicum]|uniref:Uncharacterized protein n=1 Tax=Phtheirospermum japonicum TaxID=374723 RepID=A0A830DLF2_9LAMI|nr:hypothetical protein PHJA_002818200 [Phtheirospermum japonicum]
MENLETECQEEELIFVTKVESGKAFGSVMLINGKVHWNGSYSEAMCCCEDRFASS